MRAIVLAFAFAAGCYSPHYEDCAISCTSNACPSGLECRGGMCRSPGMSGDCPIVVDDAGTDTATGDAPYGTGMWSTPVQAVSLNGLSDPSLTADMLEMYVVLANDINVLRRSSTADPWGPPMRVEELVGSTMDVTPGVSADGLTLFFSSDRPPTSGSTDIYQSTRPNRNSPWSAPVKVGGPIASNSADDAPVLSVDQLSLYFASSRTNNMNDIFVATRTSPTATWGFAVPIAELNLGNFSDSHPMLSPDQLTIYFQSNRFGSNDLFTTHRTSLTTPFDPPSAITELNVATIAEGDPWVSPDGHVIYFTRSTGANGDQIFMATR